MNFMGYGIPVVASVREDSEVARIIRASSAGWVTDSADPTEAARALAKALQDPGERAIRANAGSSFAQANFLPRGVATQFADVLPAGIGS